MEKFITWDEFYATIWKMTPNVTQDVANPNGIDAEKVAYWDGLYWSTWTSQHWEIPVVACTCYVLVSVVLSVTVKEKMKSNWPIAIWNFLLCSFSLVGFVGTAPVLLRNYLEGGWYRTVCGDPNWYGHGFGGLMVSLFIWSKIPELVDTVWLVLKRRPVIFLHWYHHITVLLYCWHSYSKRIGSGLWFATMNYFVHFIMYFYYFLSQASKSRFNKIKSKVNYLITILQLCQMGVGIVVTVAGFLYEAQYIEVVRKELIPPPSEFLDYFYGTNYCFINKPNGVLGLLMYLSYFLLFLQFYIKTYVFKVGKNASKSTGKSSKRTARKSPKKVD